jgi:hypothetical protein
VVIVGSDGMARAGGPVADGEVCTLMGSPEVGVIHKVYLFSG